MASTQLLKLICDRLTVKVVAFSALGMIGKPFSFAARIFSLFSATFFSVSFLDSAGGLGAGFGVGLGLAVDCGG